MLLLCMRWSYMPGTLYIENGKVVTNFVKICELFNGTTDTTETTLVAYMHGGQEAFNVKNGWSWHWWSQCDDQCTQWSGWKAHMVPTNSYLHPLCVPSFSNCSSSSWKWCAIHLQQIQAHTITAILLLSQQCRQDVWIAQNWEAAGISTTIAEEASRY